ncbi:TonB-dependent siderophore receptor [Bradyrhizobium sp. AUGA SZCCT0431]|uniref:TonB-dependent siderophore receptor n=1 Tax=Bradyrhizobium sp. AUGA SZCCT0431 TaxID=2807674 RepID=UPI002898466F|nr:TonB-dependent siderophore receptor [Bradyrhizobium sp. AUGA SZCCT0431]
MTVNADCRLVEDYRNRTEKNSAHLLIGAAFLLVDFCSATTIASAQSSVPLPPVTVESPTQRSKPARAAGTSARRTQAAAARQRNRNAAPAEPTPSERAAAAAAAQYEAKLGYRAMPSSTTLRTGASPLDTSQSVNIVPEQVIKDQLPRNIDDALVNISGITQTNTLAGTQDAVIRRGFGDNRDGSIMRNGMPLVQGRSLNPAVESVEVLKGPASLLYGIMDPGGIVNTISKRPELYQHGSISVLGSTYGSKHGADATFDITGPIGKDGLAYRFIAYGVNEDYWRNFGNRRETLIAPSLAWYGENTTVQLNYEHRDFLSPFDRGTALDSRTNKPLAIPATRRLDEPYNNMWGTSDLMQASIDHRINQDWKLYAAYSYNTESFSANQLRITAVNPVTGIITRSNDGTRGSLSNVSYGTSYLQGGFWIGGMRNDVLAGGDAQYRTIYRKDLIRQATPNVFNIYNPVYGLLQPGTTVSASDSDQTDKLGTRALFFQDTLHLTNRLALVGGIRYIEFEQLAGRGRPFVANTNLSGDKVLPLGGAILKLTEEISLYASYTQSLKPTSTIAPLTGGVVIGSNIAPEEGISWETGVKFDVNKRLSGTLALYDIDKKNVLVSQLNSATGVTEFRTAGKVRSHGVELDVTGKLTDSWSMIGSYGYTDARVTEDPVLTGKALQNVALNTASLYLVYDFGTALPGRLRVGAGAHYVGDRPGDAANTFVLPSYVVADVFATYETKYQTLPVIYQLNVKNLFDNVYYPSAVNNLNVAMGDARRVSLSATVKF